MWLNTYIPFGLMRVCHGERNRQPPTSHHFGASCHGKRNHRKLSSLHRFVASLSVNCLNKRNNRLPLSTLMRVCQETITTKWITNQFHFQFQLFISAINQFISEYVHRHNLHTNDSNLNMYDIHKNSNILLGCYFQIYTLCKTESIKIASIELIKIATTNKTDVWYLQCNSYIRTDSYTIVQVTPIAPTPASPSDPNPPR